MSLSFAPAEGHGLAIVDPIERRNYTLETETAVEPEPASTDAFDFPVDDAVSITAGEVVLPQIVDVYVRDAAGEMLAKAAHFAYQEFPDGAYSVELCGPIKLYFRVEGPLTVSADAERMSLDFGDQGTVLVGARSHHKHPAATITITEDPTDVMTALSYLGSALKTTSCERSYPTLRGHPPLVELGDELSIPDELDRPETGIRLELPPELGPLFVAAPLAYYLGAEVVPGPSPRIVTEAGFEHALDTARGFEAEVERVLKQVFFLDCVTRTEGYYTVDLHERHEIERLVDLDFAALYGRSPAEQLEAYLSVPYAVIEEHVPEWKLTTHIAPTAENVTSLPFVVNDLAIVRTPRARRVSPSEAQVSAVDEFMRDSDFTRSASEATAAAPQLVEPETTDSLEQAWIGEDAPTNASKATIEAFRNRLDRAPSDGDIDITVVCNDAEMDEERDVVEEVYGSREELPFDVAVHRQLTTAELRQVLATESDFLHYIGHIDAEGFECADGKLDATTLDVVGVDAFLLNACQSYEQGMALIDAGSIGGIVTLSEVINSGAITMGCNIARLLNRGFPLRAALDIARDETIVGNQYIAVGDGNVDIAQAEGGTPVLFELEKVGGMYELSLRTYPTSHRGIGTMLMPQMPGNETHYLSSGRIDTFEMSEPELEQYLDMGNFPLRLDGQFVWSEDISL